MTATSYIIKITAVINGIVVSVDRGADAADPFADITQQWVADSLEEALESLPKWLSELETRVKQSRERRLTGHSGLVEYD